MYMSCLFSGAVSVEVFNALFKLASRPEYLMPASSASQLEIGAGPKDLPFKTAAGMWLFHGQDIANLNIHYFFISSQ